MGIENFFNSFKKINNTTHIDTTKEIKEIKKLSTNTLYLDFNSIIHKTANDIEESVNYLLYAKIINKLDDRYYDIIQRYGIDIDVINSVDINTWCLDYNMYIKEHINEEFIGIEIKKYIYYIIDNLLEQDTLKNIYISIDGMPNMAKIIEQKRRRTMTYIISNLKKKVYDKYGYSLDNNRLLYEKYKYVFNRSRINPISKFMDNICVYLMSPDFIDMTKSRYTCIENIYVSSHNTHGEGEKKIINDIVVNNRTDSVIFSPDSDIIILSIIVKNILKYKNNVNSNISIIRYDMYNKIYDILYVNDFYKNIHIYIQQKIQHIKLNELSIVNDICFILTFLGNDYIPKLNSLNIKTDIELLLDVYIDMIAVLYSSNNTNIYITYYENGKFMINYIIFLKYIDILSRKENILIKELYLSNTYYNTKKLKKIFGNNVLITSLTQYISFANFMYSLRKLNKQNPKNSGIKLLPYIQTSLNQMYDNNKDVLAYLIDKFIIIENIKIAYTSNIPLWELIIMIVDNILKDPNLKPQMILFNRKYNINDIYHRNNIAKSFYHPDIKITKYDEEVYTLLRNYNKKKSSRYDIGYVKLIANNERYIYKRSNILTDSKIYYKRYFNIDITNKYDIPKLNNIINNYIKDLFWVFDFYMNRYNTDISKINNWFYKYSHSPLLYHVSKYISYNNNKLTWFHNIYNSLSSHYIDKLSFMTPGEYYVYINPIQRIDSTSINKVVYVKLLKHNKLYIDLDNISNDIWLGKDTIIDTTYTFLNKGRIMNHICIGYEEWKSIIRYIGLDINSLLYM